MKPADLLHIHNLYKKFDKNLCFTVNHFENEVKTTLPRYKNLPTWTNNWLKEQPHRPIIYFESYTPWKYEISWIRSLITWAKQICSADLLPAEIQNIKKFASWNRYPKSIRNAIIKQNLSKSSRQEQLYITMIIYQSFKSIYLTWEMQWNSSLRAVLRNSKEIFEKNCR